MVRIKVLTQNSNLLVYSVNYSLNKKSKVRESKIIAVGIDWKTCLNRLNITRFEYRCISPMGFGDRDWKTFEEWGE